MDDGKADGGAARMKTHVKSCHLFRGLSEAQVGRLAAVSARAATRTGQWLFREGHEAGVFYILETGSVELMTLVNDKFELPIAVLSETGCSFGLAALVPPFTYNVSARCVQAGEVIGIGRGVFAELVQDDHRLGCIIMTNLAEHLFTRLREARQELKVHFKSLFLLTH